MNTIEMNESIDSYNFSYQNSIYVQFRRYIWLWPLTFAISIPVFCFTFYSYAAVNNHLEPILNFVSDSGSYERSAGLFAQCLDLSAFFFFISVWARYKQLKHYLQVKIPKMIMSNDGQLKYEIGSIRKTLDRLNRINYVSLLLSFVAIFCMTMVGNFRCNEFFLLHAIGGILLFYLWPVYTGCMIYMNHHLYRTFKIESPPLTLILGFIIQLVSLVFMFIFNAMAMVQFGWNRFFTEQERLHWTSDEPGYWFHVIGTGSEWVLLISFAVTLLCISKRMKKCNEWNLINLG